MGILDTVKNLRGSLRGKEEEREQYHFVLSEPKGLIALPEEDNPEDISVTYPLIPPYARAQIRWSEVENSLVYRVSEPSLDEQEEEAYEEILDGLVELVDIRLSTIQNQRKAMDYLEDRVWQIIGELGIDLDKASYNKVMYYIYRDFVGLNRIEPLMHDPYIEDIGCVGTDTPVYIIHKRYGSMPTDIVYTDEDDLKDFVIKLAERAGRYVSYAEPLLDGSLPDGSRVQASLASDVTTRGPTFSVRKFTEDPLSPIEIMNLETADPELMAYLWFAVEQGSSMMICGGTATGKTTFLNAISMFIPPEEKVVSIEDTRELQLPHENWIPAVARLGFGAPTEGGEQYGEVDMFDLLKESFRQNPDYVIVGEVRGEEAYVMFQGMASGHPSVGTMHAAGVDTVIKRLMSPPIELSPSLVEILDIVVTMVFHQEEGKSARRVKSVTEIQSVESGGNARTNTAFRWIPSTDEFEKGEGDYLMNKIARTKGLDQSDIQVELRTRAAVLRWMQENDVTHWREVAKIIHSYYQDPDSVLEETGLAEQGYESRMEKQKTPQTLARTGREEPEGGLGEIESISEATKERPEWMEEELGKLETAIEEESMEGPPEPSEEEETEPADVEETGKRERMEKIVGGTVEEAKEKIEKLDEPDYDLLLEIEKEGKDRKTLKSWLERNI